MPFSFLRKPNPPANTRDARTRTDPKYQPILLQRTSTSFFRPSKHAFDTVLQAGKLGPECTYDEATANTADDPCRKHTSCVRCAKSDHGGKHYCTTQPLGPSPPEPGPSINGNGGDNPNTPTIPQGMDPGATAFIIIVVVLAFAALAFAGIRLVRRRARAARPALNDFSSIG